MVMTFSSETSECKYVYINHFVQGWFLSYHLPFSMCEFVLSSFFPVFLYSVFLSLVLCPFHVCLPDWLYFKRMQRGKLIDIFVISSFFRADFYSYFVFLILVLCPLRLCLPAWLHFKRMHWGKLTDFFVLFSSFRAVFYACNSCSQAWSCVPSVCAFLPDCIL